MNEIERITAACRDACARGEAAALATVVAVYGSAYRRPGARMLVAADGRSAGAVSGGCLERDVRRHASRVLGGAEPLVLLYDSTDEELGEGFALGCNGAVRVLVERIDDALAQRLDFLSACARRRVRGVMVTVFATGGHAGVRVGARVTGAADAPFRHDGIDDAALRARLEEAAAAALRSGRPAALGIGHDGCGIEAFVEVVEPAPQVLVFGAGHDVAPLVQFGKALGWHVGVAAAAGGYGVRERFRGADALFVGPAEAAAAALGVDENSIVLLMSHNYPQDLCALRAVWPRRPRYLGLLGPRRRAERLLDELAATGETVDAELRARVFGPVGLDIGAETPEEVALAIVAEIRAVTLGRAGGSSRLRAAPLHDAAAAALPARLPREAALACGLLDAG